MLAVAAPVAPALPLLASLLILVIALGICYAIVYVTKAFFGLAGGVLGKLPVVGGWINSGLHSIEQKVVGIMAVAIRAVEAEVGASWHQLARLVDWMGREIRSHSNLIYTLAAVMLGQEWAAAIRYALTVNIARIHALIKAVNAQVARIAHAEERLRHGIGADVLPHIRALDREIGRIIGRDLADVRAREQAIEHGAINTWRWIRSHPTALATTAFAGAVAVALQRLGGSWIRCPNWKRLGRSVCNVPLAFIEELLAATFVGFAVTDLCLFASVAQTVAAAFEPELMVLADVENALVGCHGATAPPDLTIAALSLPTPTNPLSLAA